MGQDRRARPPPPPASHRTAPRPVRPGPPLAAGRVGPTASPGRTGAPPRGRPRGGGRPGRGCCGSPQPVGPGCGRGGGRSRPAGPTLTMEAVGAPADRSDSKLTDVSSTAGTGSASPEPGSGSRNGRKPSLAPGSVVRRRVPGWVDSRICGHRSADSSRTTGGGLRAVAGGLAALVERVHMERPGSCRFGSNALPGASSWRDRPMPWTSNSVSSRGRWPSFCAANGFSASSDRPCAGG